MALNSTLLNTHQDIIQCILEQCQSDTPTMKECSLVSRLWSDMAQRFLLSFVSLHDNNLSRNFSSFISLPKPFHSRVRHVSVLGGEWVTSKVLGLIAHLPQLETLSFSHATLYSRRTPPAPHHDVSSFSPLPTGRVLKSLQIIDSNVLTLLPGLSPLTELTLALRTIHEVKFWGLSTYVVHQLDQTPSSAPPSTPPPRTTVDFLATIPDTTQGSEYTLASYIFHRIDRRGYTFSLANSPDPSRWTTQKMIDATQGLRHLRLALDELGNDVPLSLSSCQNLQTIAFTRSLPAYVFEDINIHLTSIIPTDFPRSISVLSSLPPPSPTGSDPTLQEITYEFWIMDMGGILDVDLIIDVIMQRVRWTDLGLVLRRFSQLEALSANFIPLSGLGSEEGEKATSLPVVKRRVDLLKLSGMGKHD